MIDTAGSHGPVPSEFYVGEHPRNSMPENYTGGTTSDERGKIALSIIIEMKHQIDRMRITHELSHNVPKATDMVYEPGYHVLVWRQKEHYNKNG